MLFHPKISKGGMTDEWGIGIDLEGSSGGLIEVVSYNLTGTSEENDGESQ
jgi:hypothetical protein